MVRHFGLSNNVKIESIRERILNKFSDDVVGILVIGSITKEATPNSDIDVAVIFNNVFFSKNLEYLKNNLAQIANELNQENGSHEIVIWPSKVDHYQTLLPDVSYIRANLPITFKRLDAWCGLAKHTLIAYEKHTCLQIYGDSSFLDSEYKILITESIELFLIATRTLADGISRFAKEQRNVLNSIAKAGLRAAYSVTIRKDQTARNSYKDIRDAAINHFPAKYHSLISNLYQCKTSSTSFEISIQDVLNFFRYCELQIADIKRLQTGGLSKYSLGEGFSFDPESMFGQESEVKNYTRCAIEENYYHYLYFLATSYEIVKRLMEIESRNVNLLDFYFEEITVIATFAIFYPEGFYFILGRMEREDIFFEFGPSFLTLLAPLCFKLATHCLKNVGDEPNSPWLDNEDKQNRLELILTEMSILGGVSFPPDTDTAREKGLTNNSLFKAIEWQCSLFSNGVNELILSWFNDIALKLYQSGLVENANRILQLIIPDESVLNQNKAIFTGNGINSWRKTMDKELSKSIHIYGVTLHRLGNIDEAKEEYLRALSLDFANEGAVDDLVTLLINEVGDEDSEAFLELIPKRLDSNNSYVRRQISDLYMLYAVKKKQQEYYSEAEKWYNKAIDMDPNYERPYFNMGRLYEALNDTDMAKSLYQKSIDLNPNYYPPYLNLGLILENNCSFNSAIEILRKAILNGIADDRANVNLGNCYMQINDYDTANEYFLKGLGINDKNADAFNGLGIISLEKFRHSGKRKDLISAITHFESAMNIDPQFEGAIQNYNYALHTLKSGNEIEELPLVKTDPTITESFMKKNYLACKRHANNERSIGSPRGYCRTWLTFLKKVFNSSHYEIYRDEFLFDMAGYAHELCSGKHYEKWFDALDDIYDSSSFDNYIKQVLEFFIGHCSRDYVKARNAIKSHPLANVFISLFLCERKPEKRKDV